MKNIQDYELIIFDCDGVLLNSNLIKSEAFKHSTNEYGAKISDHFVEYHKRNGGISRYRKFQYFIEKILEKDFDQDLYNKLLQNFSDFLKKELVSCEIAEDLYKLKKITKKSKWMVASGGDQDELRDVFSQRGIYDYFEYGIHGSPKTKETIFRDEITKLRKDSVIFLGDSKYDYLVAKKFGIDFIFLSKWTEFIEWESYCDTNVIRHFPELKCLIS
tara:strand:+ start:822 stop:1472 length:651 start_codon:yes stop_codon:yes gene_type:complete